jgi:hypothetical protein
MDLLNLINSGDMSTTTTGLSPSVEEIGIISDTESTTSSGNVSSGNHSFDKGSFSIDKSINSMFRFAGIDETVRLQVRVHQKGGSP